ncbi:PGF-pre-PGF domain-containing protein [Halopiger goleimassiliensis]|uniref:PGF-pre-PGF domain-containing protein n=1 Tax=Halopiger goleimassiliensis TaxID=1293048 RepID=UPI00067785BD|nr:PGF-pre-PGF domain-containing protein [Halopiger goleimassiliensis]
MSRGTLRACAIVALFVTGALVGVAPLGVADAVSANPAQSTPDSYVVEQGEMCRAVEPLETDGTVESFYDYRNHETHPDLPDEERLYSSYGTTHLQEENTSALMLHEGTDGTSLVMVHDRFEEGSTGGMVTFDIVGLPAEAEWTVQDDRYDAPSNVVEWDREGDWAYASWLWREGRTDGGAINGGLDGEFAVTIQPGFNEASDFHGDEMLDDLEWYEDGEIEDWEFLSGDEDAPNRQSLDLAEPVTIRTGTCDDPSITYDRYEGGTAIGIAGASPDDVVSVQPGVGSSDNASIDALELTGIDGTATLTVSHDRPADLPASPYEDVDPPASLTIDTDATSASATVTFTVESDWVDDVGYEADEVALYAAEDGEWTPADTTLVEEPGTSYRYEAEVDSLEALTVAPAPDAGGTDEDSAALPMSGFAAIVSIGALLLTALALARRSR